VKLERLSQRIRNQIAAKPVMAEKRAARPAPLAICELPDSNSLRPSKRPAPTMAGIESRNEKRAASARS
jgi:hypothetical protein